MTEDLRQQLHVRFWCTAPALHEVEVGIRRANTSPVPKVVRPPCCLGSDRHVTRRALDMHGGYRLQGPGYDGVGSDLRPQVVGLPQEVGEHVQRRIELLLPGRETTGELGDRLEVSAAEIVRIQDAGGVQSDVDLVLETGMPVGDFGQVATRDRELVSKLRVIAGSPDKA